MINPIINPKVDLYLEDGCGRCEFYQTPQCKVHQWTQEFTTLRKIVLGCGLKEELKWSMPCYTERGKNILIVAAFNDYASLNFFKGALIKDELGLLEKPGENTQAGRLLKFTDVERINELQETIESYIYEAVEIEKAGLELKSKKVSEMEMPIELETAFSQDPTFENAFFSLTPGRQKGYILYFAGAKQSKTRASRIEKYMDKILSGKGFHD